MLDFANALCRSLVVADLGRQRFFDAARYLLDYLGVVKGDKVIMETEGELKAAVFRIPGNEFLHVIMPVRTQN